MLKTRLRQRLKRKARRGQAGKYRNSPDYAMQAGLKPRGLAAESVTLGRADAIE